MTTWGASSWAIEKIIIDGENHPEGLLELELADGPGVIAAADVHGPGRVGDEGDDGAELPWEPVRLVRIPLGLVPDLPGLGPPPQAVAVHVVEADVEGADGPVLCQLVSNPRVVLAKDASHESPRPLKCTMSLRLRRKAEAGF